MEKVKRFIDLEKLPNERVDEIKIQITDLISEITKDVNGKISNRLKTTEKNANKKCQDIIEDIRTKLNEYMHVYGVDVKPEIKLQMVLKYEPMKK